MQLASHNPPLRTGCFDYIGIIFSKAYWATPFKMQVDLRPVFGRFFAELSRKYFYPQAPAISGTANTTRLGVWLSQSLTFGNLVATYEAKGKCLPDPGGRKW